MKRRIVPVALILLLVAVCPTRAERVDGINYKGKWRNAQWLRAKYRDHAPYMVWDGKKCIDTQRYHFFRVSGIVFQVLDKDKMLFDCRGVYRSKGSVLTRRIYLQGMSTAGLVADRHLLNAIPVWRVGNYSYTDVIQRKHSVSRCYYAPGITEDQFLDALRADFDLVIWRHDRKEGWVSEPDY